MDPHRNSRSTSSPPATHSSAVAPITSKPTYTAYQSGGLFVQVMHLRLLSMFLSRERHAVGAPNQDDDDLLRDEDYIPPSPNLNSQPLPEGQITAGEHGSGRFCGCF
ncbi:uncharacterized protein EDB91DRAFT_1243311 [Suillus paluster]|uniref:uncharacterized protein n=1 Tax=Suillus paluster TaxID=48578 RepID=UPI001B86C22B|nr:uncharacterized protein EDB91DRAFT_1243311 [Suillus paluster]KAG1752552.1 hypothetical protein EDB91DRAFT_1243311 [Suillus paluster]